MISRLLALVALCGLLSCTALAENELTRFLEGAELQYETDLQGCTLAAGLAALRLLPAPVAAEMRVPALAGDGRSRTLVELLQDHVLPGAPVALPDAKTVYQDAQSLEAITQLATLEATVREGLSCGP